MKSILLLFKGKVVRYIRGEKANAAKFAKLVDNARYFGCIGWCVDNVEAYTHMGWDEVTLWGDITEVTVEEIA